MFDDMTLVQLIVERKETAVDKLPEGIRKSPEAVAETIENNVRRLIIDETAVNPKYYQQMSKLLDDLILQRRNEAMDYKEYLAKIVDLTVKVSKPETQTSYPASINTTALRSLFDNLGRSGPLTVGDQPSPYEFDGSLSVKERKAIALDRAVRRVKKADWRGHQFKEREVRIAIKLALGEDEGLENTIFEIVKAQRDY